MAKTLGYMLTWTTYGSWLQGEKRRYVSDGKILDGDENLYAICKHLQKEPAVKLRYDEKQIVKRAILNEAERIELELEALAVCSNHVHLLVRYSPTPIGEIVSRFKNISTSALKEHGRSGKIWTRGFDKRFCYDNKKFDAYIEYIDEHNKQTYQKLNI
jgi:REP element-mobilizing transposase RayT